MSVLVRIVSLLLIIRDRPARSFAHRRGLRIKIQIRDTFVYRPCRITSFRKLKHLSRPLKKGPSHAKLKKRLRCPCKEKLPKVAVKGPLLKAFGRWKNITPRKIVPLNPLK